MGKEKLVRLERELSHSYTESLSINTDSRNPHLKEVLIMLADRALSLSLRKNITN